MKDKFFFSFIVILLFFCVRITQAGAVFEKAPIEIVTTSEDIVGQKLISKIKERITRSDAIRVTNNKKEPRLKISIVTLDPWKDSYKGKYTIYSLVISYSSGLIETFITQYVGITSDREIKEASERICFIINDKRYHYEEYSKLPNYGELMDMFYSVTEKLKKVQAQLDEEKSKSWWQKIFSE